MYANSPVLRFALLGVAASVVTLVVIVTLLVGRANAQTGMDDIEQRLDRLEESVSKKDFWDKLEASGAVVGGVLVALIGGFATRVYNRRQEAVDLREKSQDRNITRIKTVGELMPFLGSGTPSKWRRH